MDEHMNKSLILEAIPKKRSKFLQWVTQNGFNLFSVTGNKDIILNLLFKAGGDRPISFTIIAVIIFVAPSFFIAWFEGVLFSSEIKTDLVHGIGNWSLIGAFALFSIFSIKFYTLFEKVIYKLYINNVLNLEFDDFNKKMSDWANFFNNNFIFIITYIITGIVVFIAIRYKFLNIDSWDRLSEDGFLTYTSISTIPLNIFSLYILTQFAIRVSLCYFFINDLIKNIRVHTLHPDNCGGLGAIGELSMNMNIIIFLSGLLVAGQIYSCVYILELPIFNIGTIITIIAYLFISILMAFTPIFITHGSMTKAKNEVLNLVNFEFEAINKSLQEKLRHSKQDEYQDELNKIQELHNLYDLINRQPVWPFNITVFYTFIGSIIPPFLVVLIEVFFQKIIKL